VAIRYDIGQLRPAKKRPDGSVIAEGYLTRTGVFTYRNADGSMRRELRLPEEVFAADALESFDDVPVTDDHPPEGVHAGIARGLMVGHVRDVKRDGEHVRSVIAVHDASTIQKMERGKVQLSCGYSCDFEATPGTWQGQTYDGVQRRIRGNHVAIVDTGRAGPSARVRMDGEDSMMIEDAVLNAAMRHEMPARDFAVPGREGLPIHDEGHLRAAMARFGQFQFQDSAEKRAAYHKILAKAQALGVDASGFEREWSGRLDGNSPLTVTSSKVVPMDEIQKKLDEATKQLAAEATRADALAVELEATKKRADEATGSAAGFEARVKQLEAERHDQKSVDAMITENAALKLQLDAADVRVKAAEDPERFANAVKARCDMLDAAAPVLGDRATMAKLSDRDIMVSVVAKLQPSLQINRDDSDDLVRGYFRSVVQNFRATDRAIQRIAEAAAANAAAATMHADAATEQQKMIDRNQNAWRSDRK
jgi:hypothetical protein